MNMGSDNISGYGRCEEEAYVNAYKNFFEGTAEDSQLRQHLSNSLSKMKDSLNRSKKPPKGKVEGNANGSFLHMSIDKSINGERNKTLNNDLNRSRHNESGELGDEDRRDHSVNKLKTILGRSYTENAPDRSRHEGANKSRTPDRALYIHETHDCLYRGKYKKYKEETHKLSILVDQLQKKLKKYHEENKMLRERLEIEEGVLEIGSGGFNGSNKGKVQLNTHNNNKQYINSLDEGSVLKDSINKGNSSKNQSHHNMSVALETPTDEDSKKKIGNSHSYQDLKNKLLEKENKSILSRAMVDTHYEDKSPAKVNKKPHVTFTNDINGKFSEFGKTGGDDVNMNENNKNNIQSRDYMNIKKRSSDKEDTDDLNDVKPLHQQPSFYKDKYQKDSPEAPHVQESHSPGDKDKSGGEKKRLSVPKLKLEVLPNYHGKYNKSINHLFNKQT